MFFLFFVFIFCCKLEASSDLFSKIVVTSSQAHCQQDVGEKKSYVFSYQDDVKVVFADQSQITADCLTLNFTSEVFKSSSVKTHIKNKWNSNFKTIIFTGHVCMKRANQTVTADKAHLDVKKNLCILEGNVYVKQCKDKTKDVPFEMKSDKAIFNFKTEKISFVGTSMQPVSTTIELGDQKPLPQKNKRKRKKIRFF